ncbi:tetratricopeptide repeat protein [Stakelama sp. CBK3Z-3]|uniref:Tetratricopeptide repeat protein n=1 Tax=Stakelama flava TaxID=2860338 RepID=A0ABS6XPC9_9SPHN|nr:tetratricopeptide repeat protein [Stakelama flava]
MIGAVALAAAVPAAASERSDDLTAYIRARAAEADGASVQAAKGYGEALDAAPNNMLVALRAYREALTAGDMKLALRSVRVLRDADAAPPDSSLLLLADAVARDDEKAARGYAGELSSGPLDFLRPIVTAWLSVDDGPAKAAKQLSEGQDNALARRYVTEHHALLLIAADEPEKGVNALKPLLISERSNLDLRLNAAQLLAAKGHDDLAQMFLGGDSPTLVALRQTLGNGVKPSARFGLSRLYAELASSLGSDRLTPLATLLARGSLLMDPQYDRARLTLADALSREGADSAAEHALATIGPDSGISRMAKVERRAVLSRAGQADQALELAKALASDDSATVEDVRAYGDLLADAERYSQAADAYGRAIAMTDGSAGWALYLQRGGALEQAGDWQAALPLLEKAVEMAPDEPVALNYLGYARVERGEDVAKAQAMLERALKLKPDDPSITDSVAWAYYKQGRVAQAVPLLEKAAQAEPADVTINEHLGDAYWRAGRKYEARYAWRAAAIYAEAADAQRLQQKIANGLSPAK